MDTKKLRQKLLDLAIHGKLVPQDPNDEPASELLSRIHAEKLAMVERGELKPKDVKYDSVIYFGSDGLPYEKRADGKDEAKCIEGEIPFEIPKGWSWCRLLTPVALDPKNDVDDETPASFLPMAAIEEGFCNRYHPEVRRWKEIKKGFTQFADGDVVFAKISPCFENGKYFIASCLENGVGAGTTELYVLRSSSNGLYRKYLFYFLASNYFMGDAKKTFMGSVGQQRIKKDYLKRMLLPIPPLAEQRRIVDALDKYLALVDEIERDRAGLDGLFAQLKSKVLDLAVRGELTERDPGDEPASELLARIREEKLAMVERGELKPKDVKGDTVIFTGSDGLRYEKRADGKDEAKCIEGEIPFEIPKGWSWSRMERLIQLTSGIDLAKADYNSEHNGIPYITGASNFENGSLIENRWTDKPKRISHRGDLLFTCKGTVGKMAINKFASAHIARQVMAINPYRGVDKLYLQQVLAWHVETIRRKAKGFIPGIERGVLLKALVPVPPLAEQRRIVRAIEAVISATSL